MKYRPVINFKGENFPFGSVSDGTTAKYRQIFVKNRLYYRNQSQYDGLQQKITTLRKAEHHNFINIKSIQQTERGCIEIFFDYVHHKLQDLAQDQSFSLKRIHEQLIKMIVHAAKHFMIVPFNSKNCGVKLINGQSIIKYYFPFDDITICNDIKTIERSVNLFTVQSMQFLDELIFGRNNKINLRSHVQSRRLTFTTKGLKDQTQIVPAISIFSERHLRNSVDLHYRHNQNQTSQQTFNKTDNSTLHTIPRSEEDSRQKKLKFHKSLQKSLALRQELRLKIKVLKQRSKEALVKLNEIKIELKKKLSEKERKYTDEFKLLKRFSFDQHVRSILRSR